MTLSIGPRIDIANDNTYLAFPSAARLGDRIVATWQSSPGHYDHDKASTFASVSRDEGVTWSPPTPMTSVPGCSVELATDPSGARVAALEMAPNPYRGWTRITTDGVTWTAPKPVRWPTATQWTFPCGLTWLDDGSADGLLLAISYGGDGVLIAASRDVGSTWTHHCTVPNIAPWNGGTGESESRIVKTSSGRLLMLTRQDASDGAKVWRRYSTDMGRTWSAKAVAYPGSGMPAATLLSDGTLVATVRDETRDGTEKSWALAVSSDDGATWRVEHLSDEVMMYGQIVATGERAGVLIGASQLRVFTTPDSDIWARRISLDTPALQSQSAGAERWVVGDFTTGDVMAEVHPLDGSSWSDGLDGSVISLKLSLGAGEQAILPYIYPWRNYLAVIIDDEIMAAGPIISDRWDADSKTLTVNAKGGEVYFDRREILPVRSAEFGFGLYNFAAKATPSWSRLYWSATWPEIGASMIRQVMAWKGVDYYASTLPRIRVAPVTPYGPQGEWSADAIDHIKLSSGLRDVTENGDGVEMVVRPQWVDNEPTQGAIEWVVHFGQPLVTTGRMASWSHETVIGLTTSRDASQLTTLLHMTGGRTVDQPLSVTRGGSGSVIMLETLDSSHSDAKDVATLRRRGADRMHYLGRPAIAYEFSVPASTVGTWRPGDYGLLAGDPDAAHEWEASVPHLPAEARLRIVGRSGDAGTGLVAVHSQLLAPEDSNAWLRAYTAH